MKQITSRSTTRALGWAMLLTVMVLTISQLVAAQSGDDAQLEAWGKPGRLSEAGDPITPLFIEKADSSQSAEALSAPAINVWYGQSQSFGQIGNPQKWVNILGNVSGPNQIASLTYSLNGGAEQPLSMGPNKFRLADKGDFNIELATSSLNNGANSVVITAVDTLAETTQQTVTVNYTKNQTWPQTYTTNWAGVAKVNDVAQIVDGQWIVVDGKLRTAQFDYDRVVSIGDMSWTDYEITVPVTVHGLDEDGFDPKRPSGGAAVGVMTRWQGHYQEADEQPRNGWRDLGALSWHSWVKDEFGNIVSGLQMFGYSVGVGAGYEIGVNPDVQLDFNVPYMYKVSVQSVPDAGDIYRMKVWPQAEAEPTEWHIVAQGHPDEPTTGSMLLVAHHVDASFGDVTVRPLSSIRPKLNVTAVGGGSVTVSPDQADYAYGEEVTLTASPEVGKALARWSGDLRGNQNPVTITLTKDTNITANFVDEVYYSVSVSSVGPGTVVVTPDKAEYLQGEEVILEAVPDEGNDFAGWSGSLAGIENPATLIVDGNASITAFFAPKPTYSLNVNTIGGGSVARDPEKSSYYQGEVVKLTAEPAVGYQFDSWIGDITGSTNPVYITMDSNKNVTANFIPGESHTLDVSWEGNGRVIVEPDKPIYQFGEVVTLTAVADPGFMLGAWTGDLGGNSSPTTVVMDRNKVISATFVQAINPESDDFNSCALDTSRWTSSDPVGDSSFGMTGTQLTISVPQGTNHNLWVDGTFDENNAPRIMTPADNEDFELEVKMESPISQQFQIQGMLIQQDADNFLRFDFFHDGSNPRVFAAAFVDGMASPKYNQVITAGAEYYMRVRRVGDQWTQFYSYDGLNWTQAAKFTQAMNVTAAGLFAGNSGDDNPAHTAVFDYFFNTAMPIVPEDSNKNTLTVNVNGNGTVNRSPNKTDYVCGEQVQLTANPAAGSQFTGWGGDLSGSSNPITLTITGSHAVTANFSDNSNPPPVFDPTPDQTAFVGTPLTFNVSATDPGASQPPSLQAQNLPNGASFTDNGDGTGTFSWTPKSGQVGTRTVTFEASDGTSTSTMNVKITVKQSSSQTYLPVVISK